MDGLHAGERIVRQITIPNRHCFRWHVGALRHRIEHRHHDAVTVTVIVTGATRSLRLIRWLPGRALRLLCRMARRWWLGRSLRRRLAAGRHCVRLEKLRERTFERVPIQRGVGRIKRVDLPLCVQHALQRVGLSSWDVFCVVGNARRLPHNLVLRDPAWLRSFNICSAQGKIWTILACMS